jgi:type VI secretion system protein VasD
MHRIIMPIKALALFALVVAVTLLAACAAKPPQKEAPPPAKLRVVVAASTDVNSGAGSQALPIVVRLYELKGQGAFTGADFYSLYDRESQTLGDDLVDSEEMTLIPGQQRMVVRELGPDTRYIGAMGAYRDIDGATWRDYQPIIGGKDNNFEVEVGAKALRVVVN